MDPEIVVSLNEQIRQLNEMLSRQAVAMSGLAKSMSTNAAPALKGASDATSKSTTAQNANTASVNQLGGSVTKLEQIRQQSNQNMMAALKNFSDAAGSSGQALKSFADKLLSSEEGFTKYGDSISKVGDAAFSLGKSFGPLGFIFGGIINVGSKVLAHQAKQADALFKASDDIAKMGAAGTFTVDQIRRMGASAGLTSFELDKLIIPMKSVEGGFIGLGNTQSDGIKRFGELANVSVQVRNEFRHLGMGDQERNQALANYITMMNKSGAAYSGNLKTQQGLQKAALNYTRSLYELAELTGKDVDTLAQERNAQMDTIEVALIQSKWATDEAAAEKKIREGKTAAEREAGQKELNRIKRDKAAFDKLNQDLDMSAANAETKNAIRQQFLTGKVSAESAVVKKSGVDLDKYFEELRAGKTQKGAFAQQINEGLQKSMDNIGQNVLGMNDEVLKAYGLDQETIARLTIMMKYDMRTQAAQAAAAIKANQEGTGAAANDPMQQIRDKKVEAERVAKLAIDELEASMNPFLGNMGMLKGLGAMAGIAVAGLAVLAAVKGLSMLSSLFKKGPAESAVETATGAATEKVQVSQDQLLDKNGKPLQGAAKQARIDKLTGRKGAVVGETKKGGLSGAIKGIAEALKDAGKAAPSVIKGAGTLAIAIAEIGAGIAGATWLTGKALPTFTDGLKSFKGVAGGNLISVGLGMGGLGVGITALFSGTILAAFGSLLEFLSGGQDPLLEIGQMLYKMQTIKLDPKKVEDNGTALTAFAKAMAAISKMSASESISDAISGLADAVGSLFSDSSPIEQMVKFSQLDINLPKVINNSKAFSYFTDAMASYEGTGSATGQIGKAISDGVTSFFGSTPPFDQFVEFSKLKIDAKRTKSNATAFKFFAEAMAAYKGLGSAIGTISSTLANATAKFFGVKPPLEQVVYFSQLEIDKKKTQKNAKSFVLFSDAMSSYKGGPGLLDAVSTIAGAKLFELFKREGPIESFKRFSEMKFGDNVGKNADAFFKFAKSIAILSNNTGPDLTDTFNSAATAGAAVTGAVVGATVGLVTALGDVFKGDAGTQQGRTVKIGKELREGGTISWRTNNPGNVSYGGFSKQYGAVGRWVKPDGDKQQRTSGIAIMPTLEHGYKMKMGLWRRPMYMNKTIDQGVNQWTGNNSGLGSQYAKDIAKAAGVPIDYPVAKLSDDQLKRMVMKQTQWEGFKPGTVRQARFGGIFSGPKSGYPMELHGTEMVIPVTANSVLSKLAKSATEVSNMTFSALRKATQKSNAPDEEESANMLSPEMIFNLAKKFDNVINVLQENDSTQNKILKHSMS